MKGCPCRMIRLGLLVAALVFAAVNAIASAYESAALPRGEDWTVVPGWWDTNLAYAISARSASICAGCSVLNGCCTSGPSARAGTCSS
jgi:hypothetical protein